MPYRDCWVAGRECDAGSDLKSSPTATALIFRLRTFLKVRKTVVRIPDKTYGVKVGDSL